MTDWVRAVGQRGVQGEAQVPGVGDEVDRGAVTWDWKGRGGWKAWGFRSHWLPQGDTKPG